MDMLRDRLEILNTIEPFIGEWFSKEYVQKHVFRMTEDEIKGMEKSIDSEPPPPDIESDGDKNSNVDDRDDSEGEEPEEEEIQIDSKRR